MVLIKMTFSFDRRALQLQRVRGLHQTASEQPRLHPPPPQLRPQRGGLLCHLNPT